MHIGLIKWFDIIKGFGVIVCNEVFTESDRKRTFLSEVFLHKNNWNDNLSIDPTKNIPVVFNTALERGKIAAKNCKYFSNTKEYWSTLFQYLGNNEEIFISDRYSSNKINLIESSFKSLNNNFKEVYLKEALDLFFQSLKEEDIEIKCNTLINYYLSNSSSNRILNELLEQSIKSICSKLSPIKKTKICIDKNIPIRFLPKSDIIFNSVIIEIEQLKIIKEHPDSDEIINLIILNKVKNLQVKFSIEEFLKIEEYLSFIN